MIKKIRNILVLFLFLQLLFFSIQNFKSVRPKFNLNSEFSFELINLNEVKEFEIRDKSGSVKFDKRGQNWFFKANGEQAYSDKIETKLAEIKSIKINRSVINKEGPFSDLRVGDDNYRKKITLISTETLIIFIGRINEAGRSYVRIGGDNTIYEVDFVFDDLVTDPKLWLTPRS